MPGQFCFFPQPFKGKHLCDPFQSSPLMVLHLVDGSSEEHGDGCPDPWLPDQILDSPLFHASRHWPKVRMIKKLVVASCHFYQANRGMLCLGSSAANGDIKSLGWLKRALQLWLCHFVINFVIAIFHWPHNLFLFLNASSKKYLKWIWASRKQLTYLFGPSSLERVMSVVMISTW